MVSLVARVERLSREERMRIRQEIAGMLARHGFYGFRHHIER
jgi:hypothetical protein